jgi:cytochrome o ubiquinol oxidase subunit 3
MSGAHQEDYEKTLFGFWVYLITDFMLFGSIFAAYIVLEGNTFNGPSGKDLFSLCFALIQSFLFLFVAFASGLGSYYAHQKKQRATNICWGVVAVLAGLFLWRLFQEFAHVDALGYSWKTSAFLSAYYTLNGMFAIHVICGLIWTVLSVIYLFFKGFSDVTLKRISCLKMFWQFLNIIWIFLFAIVYLLGAS